MDRDLPFDTRELAAAHIDHDASQVELVLPRDRDSHSPCDDRQAMNTNELTRSLTTLFSELIDGAKAPVGGNFVLNSGDPGLLASLDKLSAADASGSVHGGATIAAHAQHVRYGLSLMNRWATKGGNPFADAKWDEAWKTPAVNDAQWAEIHAGLADEAHRWLEALGATRDVSAVELSGMIGSIVHLAYHVGAIRQIAASARGPRDDQVRS